MQGTPQIDRDVEIGGTHVDARERVDEDVEGVDLVIVGAGRESQALGDELIEPGSGGGQPYPASLDDIGDGGDAGHFVALDFFEHDSNPGVLAEFLDE